MLPAQFLSDFDVLKTMAFTLAAFYAQGSVMGLVFKTGFQDILPESSGLALDIPVIVTGEAGWNVYPFGARHAIIASGAGNFNHINMP